MNTGIFPTEKVPATFSAMPRIASGDIGKVYRIVPNNPTDKSHQYFGSTTQPYISSRFATHKYMYKRFLDGAAGYCSSYWLFNEYGVENCKIETVEELEGDCSETLKQRENHYITLSPNVNKRIAYRSLEERREYERQKAREWYANNTERKKQYYKEHADYHRQYYQDHKEKLTEYMKTRVVCPNCQTEMNRSSLAPHRKRCGVASSSNAPDAPDAPDA
jgi:hypothetical protein